MSAAPDPIQIILLMFVFLVLSEILRALSAGTLLAPPQPRRQLQFDWAVLAASSLFISLNVLPVLLQPFLTRAETAVAKRAPEVAVVKPAPETAPAKPAPEAAVEKPARTSLRVEAAVLTNFVIIAVLVVMMVARRKNQLADYGVDVQGWLAEVRFGGLGFLACLPFVIAIIVLSSHWRSPETQNPLLILLRQTGSERTVWEVVFAAVVSAPLAEELLFRVAFQGPLETRLRPAWAIAVPACVFAGVHGPYDALPLLPLALTLGCLYHFRRSYVAVVTAHALFNASFLILALSQRGGS
jgi:membrane protease YdiL (CAAX protease family)